LSRRECYSVQRRRATRDPGRQVAGKPCAPDRRLNPAGGTPTPAHCSFTRRVSSAGNEIQSMNRCRSNTTLIPGARELMGYSGRGPTIRYHIPQKRSTLSFTRYLCWIRGEINRRNGLFRRITEPSLRPDAVTLSKKKRSIFALLRLIL